MKSTIAALLLCLAGITAAPAAVPPASDRTLADFHHTAWTAKDGAPLDVWAMAQTADGWIWLGAPTGLYRFDGLRFESVPLDPDNPERAKAISTLFALESGELWIGYVFGGASVLRDGEFTHYGAAEGMASGTTVSFEQDYDGVLWAGCASALLRFDGQKWHRVGADLGFTESFALSVYLDDDGDLLASSPKNIWRFDEEAKRFSVLVPSQIEPAELIQSPDGRYWYSNHDGVHALPTPAERKPRDNWRGSRSSFVTLFARDGAIWTASGHNLRRMSRPDKQPPPWLHTSPAHEVFGESQGLTNQVVKTLMEDREGNVWVSTVAGIDRFRHADFRQLPQEPARSMTALAPGDDGALWFGATPGLFDARFAGLWKYDGELRNFEAKRLGNISAIHRAGSWFYLGGANGVFRTDGRRFENLPALPEGARGQRIHMMTVDAAGNPWAAVMRSKLFKLQDGAWIPNGGITKLPDARVHALHRDTRGRLWTGYEDSTVWLIDGEQLTRYGRDEGLRVGLITSIHSGKHTLVAGRSGWALFDGQQFHRLSHVRDPLVFEGITGIHETREGDIWFAGLRGAGLILSAELERAAKGDDLEIAVEIFDAEDGFPGIAQQLRPLPTLIEGTDGRLWFAGTSGIGWVDPGSIQRNSVAPTVFITHVIADEQHKAVEGEVNLDAGTRRLEFDFTALSYARPEATQFRYQLVGFDEAYVEAGPRRQAFYTNLAPGEYRFKVIAANEDDVWNDTGAEVTLHLPPTFTQTPTFILLCVAAGLLLLAVVYALRLGQIRQRERQLAVARLMERERIARDLHDTLIQSAQALILKFHSAAKQLPEDQPLRGQLDEAVDRAEDLLTESRARVKSLRKPREPSRLESRIEDLYKATATDTSAQFKLTTQGHARPLRDDVQEELELIVAEALRNALRHARAVSVEVEIIHTSQQLTVIIRDDGRGMEAQIVAQGREGHFGLVGMRERAAKIQAELTVTSAPGAGTTVEITIPAASVYTTSL